MHLRGGPGLTRLSNFAVRQLLPISERNLFGGCCVGPWCGGVFVGPWLGLGSRFYSLLSLSFVSHSPSPPSQYEPCKAGPSMSAPWFTIAEKAPTEIPLFAYLVQCSGPFSRCTRFSILARITLSISFQTHPSFLFRNYYQYEFYARGQQVSLAAAAQNGKVSGSNHHLYSTCSTIRATKVLPDLVHPTLNSELTVRLD